MAQPWEKDWTPKNPWEKDWAVKKKEEDVPEEKKAQTPEELDAAAEKYLGPKDTGMSRLGISPVNPMEQTLDGNDAARAINKALLTKGGPVGDVALGVALPLAGAVAAGPAGGMAASVASDALVQARQILRGDRKDTSEGSLIASGLVGAIIPPAVKEAGSALGTFGKTIGVRALQGVGLGAGHSVLRQAIDDQSINAGQVATEGALGGVFGGAFGGVEGALPLARAFKAGATGAQPKKPSIVAQTEQAMAGKMDVNAIGQETSFGAHGADEPSEYPLPSEERNAGRDTATIPDSTGDQNDTLKAFKAIVEKQNQGVLDSVVASADEASLRADLKARGLDAQQHARVFEEAELARKTASDIHDQLINDPQARIDQLNKELRDLNFAWDEHQRFLESKQIDATAAAADPVAIDHRNRAQAIANELDALEQLRQSPKGGVLLKNDLKAKQGKKGMPEVDVEAPLIEKPSKTSKTTPEKPEIEYLGKKYLVAEGVGDPVEQWQVKFPGEERGRTLTREQMTKEGIDIPSKFNEKGMIPNPRSFYGKPGGKYYDYLKDQHETALHELNQTKAQLSNIEKQIEKEGSSRELLEELASVRHDVFFQEKGVSSILRSMETAASNRTFKDAEQLLINLDAERENIIDTRNSLGHVLQRNIGAEKVKALDAGEIDPKGVIQKGYVELTDRLMAIEKEMETTRNRVNADRKYQKDKRLGQEGGRINPAVMANVSAPLVGGTIGYQVGNTDEERMENAKLGALIATGGTLAATAMARLAKSNPALLAKLKAGIDAITKTKATGAETPLPERMANQGAPAPELANPQEAYQWRPFLSELPGGKVLKKFLGTIEGNVGAVNKPMLGTLRDHQALIDNLRVKWVKGTEDLAKEARSEFTRPDLIQINYKILFGNHAEASEAMAKYGNQFPELFAKAKATYDDMAASSESVGRTINRIDNAWPRKLVNHEIFMEFLDKEEVGAIDQLFRQGKKDKGRELNAQEKSELINNAISLSLQGKPSFLKERTVKGLTPESVWRLYEPFDVSMADRIQRVSSDVARRKFLGKDSPEDIEHWDGETGDFGKVLLREKEAGNISMEGERVILDNLKDYLKTVGRSEMDLVGFGNWISRNQNVAFISDITSAIAQYGDVFPILRTYGPSATAGGYMDMIAGKGAKLSDIGISSDSFAEAMGNSHKRETIKLLRKAAPKVDAAYGDVADIIKTGQKWVLDKMVGISDVINKGAAINASRRNFVNALKDEGSREFIRINQRYSKIFPEKWPEMLKDLRGSDFSNGKLNDNTRSFLYNELARLQPMSTAQRAQFESAYPGFRFLYSLKRYWVAQMNMLRTDGYEKLKIPGERIEGTKNIMLWLLLVGAAQGLAINSLRDMIFDRHVNPVENAVSGVAQTFGVSRHTIQDLRQAGPAEALAGFAFPISQPIMDVYKDVGTITHGGDFEQLRSTKYIPIVGRLLNRYYGSGQDSAQQAEQQRLKDQRKGEPSSPTIAELEKLLAPGPSKGRERK